MPPRLNIPPLTRSILIALAALSILNGAIRYRAWTALHSADQGQTGDANTPPTPTNSYIVVPYLTIVPSLSLIYPWVFLSATLVEQNVFTLLITGATLFYGRRYLERAWSTAELGKFLLIVSLVPNFGAFFTYIAWYAITRNPDRSLTTISGGVAIQAAFLVAFKQLVPEHTVTIARGLIKMRVKHFPALFLLGNTLAGLLLGTDTALILAWLGFLSSWTYLRFYRSTPSLTTSSTAGGEMLRGDASETFAFAYFFPDPMHAPVAAVADAGYNILVAIRVCTPFSAEDIDAGNEQASARGEAGLPSLLGPGGARGGLGRSGGKREEAERRRALALKALDQRLNATTNKPPVAPIQSPAPPTQTDILGSTSYTPEGQEGEAQAEESQA